jgi:hypothetical protein
LVGYYKIVCSIMHEMNNIMELCIISILYEFTSGCINLSLFCRSYIFSIPTKFTYTIEHMFYYQNLPTCFGTYCAISWRTISKLLSLLLAYYGYNYYTKNTWNGKLHAKFILFGSQILLNVIAVILNISIFRMQEADSGFVLVIDRRNDKWHSVKTVLLKISVGV